MENGKKINHLALWPALALLAVLIGFGVFKTEALGSLLTTILYGMADKGGWFFCLFTILAIILTFVLALTKIGDIKIGGPDATPDYKTWNWITMSLCGGIGTGLLFWAMGEPMYHFMTPPVAAGVEAGSRGVAAREFHLSRAQGNSRRHCRGQAWKPFIRRKDAVRQDNHSRSYDSGGMRHIQR